MRTSSLIERSIPQKMKRRTGKARVFPSQDSLLRLLSAILFEIDERWASQNQPYIKWITRMRDQASLKIADLGL